MGDIPSVTPQRLIRALEKLGCVQTRQRGSHVYMINHQKKSRTCVTMHSGEIKKNNIRTILKQIDISEEEFRNSI